MNQALALEILLFEQETSLRLLVATEDTNLRRMLAAALRRDGHEVVEARDAAEVLEALASTLIEPMESPFDVVICEQALPVIRGAAVVDRLDLQAIRAAVRRAAQIRPAND